MQSNIRRFGASGCWNKFTHAHIPDEGLRILNPNEGPCAILRIARLRTQCIIARRHDGIMIREWDLCIKPQVAHVVLWDAQRLGATRNPTCVAAAGLPADSLCSNLHHLVLLCKWIQSMSLIIIETMINTVSEQ